MVLYFQLLELYSYDTLELMLKSPDASLIGHGDEPGFDELLSLCGEIWPGIWAARSFLTQDPLSERLFVFLRASGAESFEFVEPQKS